MRGSNQEWLDEEIYDTVEANAILVSRDRRGVFESCDYRYNLDAANAPVDPTMSIPSPFMISNDGKWDFVEQSEVDMNGVQPIWAFKLKQNPSEHIKKAVARICIRDKQIECIELFDEARIHEVTASDTEPEGDGVYHTDDSSDSDSTFFSMECDLSE